MNNRQTELAYLETAAEKFFADYGTRRLLGNTIFKTIDPSDGTTFFRCLMERCGYKENPAGFFRELRQKAKEHKTGHFQINGVEIPLLFVYRMLEILFPGERLHAIKNTDELEKAALMKVENPGGLQDVIDMFPVRLSDHVIRQSLVSDAVSRQYLPFPGELDDSGHVITFDGHFKNGVVEQMYRNRVIFLLDMTCPVYCRFCFRKHKSKRKEKAPGTKNVLAAVEYVRAHPSIHEILITGGEPLWNRRNFETAINGLTDITHVNAIRVATRSVFYYPELFLKNDGRYIRYLIDKNKACIAHGKRIEIGVHVVHPDEISVQSLEIISTLVENGIQVYVQTPYLEQLNTKGETLGKLFSLLRQAGAQIYYIFTPCSPIHGTKTYWSPIKKAIDAQRELREKFSDRLVPKLCTATSLGKIEWHTSGWAVEKDQDDPEYTWIRTPYTLEYFKAFIRDMDDMPDLRKNAEGTLDTRYRLVMGEESLFCGSRKGAPSAGKQAVPSIGRDALKWIYTDLFESPALAPSIRPVPHSGISRVHTTRVEIMLEDGPRMEQSLNYIAENTRITDVVVYWTEDPSALLSRVLGLAERLKGIQHVVCLRLRSSALSLQPEKFTMDKIQTIASLCSFSVGTPFRVEMETWFIEAGQVTAVHQKKAGSLIDNGVNVYANAAMIPGINDTPKAMLEMAYNLRKAKIEFHHLYAAGLDIQKKLGCSLDCQKVIDVASHLRAECSGRQIPLYMVRTPDGDKDFGLDPLFSPFSP